MTLLVVENYPHTDLGLLGRVASTEGVAVEAVRAFEAQQLPETPGDYSGLVVLGGAQNALADDAYPHLPDVCTLIRAFHHAERPVLGICLGSQLIARAFGGTNVLGRPVEFGWQEVLPTEAGSSDPVIAALGQGAFPFHWHSDTVMLPEGAVHLAHSKMTEVQAFRLGRATYAIQFHFEAGEPEVRRWSEAFFEDIVPHTPDWGDRLPIEAARHSRNAEEVGAALSRAWLSLLR